MMSAPAKLLAFALVLALTFAGASFAGAAMDPRGDEAPAASERMPGHRDAAEQPGGARPSTPPGHEVPR